MPATSMTTTPLGRVMSIPFPGRIIKMNDADSTIVTAIQNRLNEVGCGPIDADGDFGSKTRDAIKLFQSRFTDADGNPLKVDGEIGSLTWGALFGVKSVPTVNTSPSRLIKEVLAFAATQIGVRERPLGSNRGPEVDQYLRAVGLDPADDSFAWCVAFTHFCYLKAAEKLGVNNPHIKTAGVLDHWNKANGKPGVKRVVSNDAINDPGLVKPGALFIISTGSGLGHSGIVVSSSGGLMVTIEGNTNDGGSRNGIGVFQRNSRKINSINKGFIDYSSF